MKLKEYVNSIKDRINKKNIFVYVEKIKDEEYCLLTLYQEDKEQYNRIFLLPQKTNKEENTEIYVGFTSLFRFPIDEISSYWLEEYDFNPDGFIEMTKDKYEDWITDKMRKNVERWKIKHPEQFEQYKEEINRNGSKIYYQKHDNTYWILIGVASTDEDYYWVLVNRKGELIFYSCVGHIPFMDEEKDKSNYECKLLKEYLNENKKEIKNKLNNLKQIVIFDSIFR